MVAIFRRCLPALLLSEQPSDPSADSSGSRSTILTRRLGLSGAGAPPASSHANTNRGSCNPRWIRWAITADRCNGLEWRVEPRRPSEKI